MKRSPQFGKKRNLFMACLRAAAFCLLFAVTTLSVANAPSRHALKSGVTGTTPPTASPELQQAVIIVPPFVGDHTETWEEFGAVHIPNGTPILGGIATITGTKMVTARHFVMCSVTGHPSDGTILMDQD